MKRINSIKLQVFFCDYNYESLHHYLVRIEDNQHVIIQVGVNVNVSRRTQSTLQSFIFLTSSKCVYDLNKKKLQRSESLDEIDNRTFEQSCIKCGNWIVNHFQSFAQTREKKKYKIFFSGWPITFPYFSITQIQFKPTTDIEL